MTALRHRLHQGNPTWLDQLVFRLPGVALLACCWYLAARLFASAPVDRAHWHGPAQLALPMLIVLCLHSGLLLVVLGPCLLREYPWPATSRYRPLEPPADDGGQSRLALAPDPLRSDRSAIPPSYADRHIARHRLARP